MKKIDKKDIIFEEFNRNLIKNISVSGGLKNFALIFYFILREVFLYNWLNTTESSDFTIFSGYIDLCVAFTIITPSLLPKFFQEIKPNQRKVFVKITLVILFINYFIINSIFFVIFLFGYEFGFSNFDGFLFFVLLSVSSILPILLKLYESILYGLKKPKKIGFVNIVLSCFFAFFLIFFYTINFLNIITVILTTIISNSAAIILAIRYYKKTNIMQNQGNEINSIKMEVGKKILKFSFPLFFASFFYFINFKIGVLFLNQLSGEYVVLYHISTSIVIMLVGLLGLPINDMIYPYLAESYIKDEIGRIKKIYEFILPLISIFLIGSLSLLYWISPFLINILYPEYHSILFVNLFKIICIGGIFYCLNQFLSRFSIAKGKTNVILYTHLSGGIITVIFLYLSVHYSDLLYAGSGFLLSSIVMLSIYIFYTRKYSQLSLKQMKIGRILIATFIPIFLYEVLLFFTDNLLLSVIFSIIFFIGSFLTLRVFSIKYLVGIASMLKSLIRSVIFKKK